MAKGNGKRQQKERRHSPRAFPAVPLALHTNPEATNQSTN